MGLQSISFSDGIYAVFATIFTILAAIGVMNNAIGKETINPITNDFSQIMRKSDTKPIDTYVITSDMRKDIANAIMPPNNMSDLFN